MKYKTKKLIKCDSYDAGKDEVKYIMSYCVSFKVKYIMSYCTSFKDNDGECIYTFKTKKKAEQFMKELTKAKIT